MTQQESVVVIGGGLAGLAASIKLLQQGFAVTLLEGLKFLGGRVYSYKERHTGEVIDNSQHAITSAYHNTLEYCRTIGTEDKFSFPKGQAGFFRDPHHGLISLKGPKLPKTLTPFRGLLGFALLKNVPLNDKLKMGIVMPRLIRGIIREPAHLENVTVAQWFNRINMPKSMRRAFWDPLIISALNEKPEKVSAALFTRLMNWGFIEQKPGKLGYATTDLSSAFVTPAISWIENNGGKVVTGEYAVDLSLGPDNRVKAVVCRKGNTYKADYVLSALPSSRFARLIDNTSLASHPFFQQAGKITSSPIFGFHLWYDQPLNMVSEYEALLDTTIEWVFDHNRIKKGRQGKDYFYTIIVSAAWSLNKKTRKEIKALVKEEMALHYPETRKYTLLHFAMNKEPIATFSGKPGFRDLRCSQVTPVPNLFMAGDWTDTKLPCTIESAVKSSHLAAQAIEKRRSI